MNNKAEDGSFVLSIEVITDAEQNVYGVFLYRDTSASQHNLMLVPKVASDLQKLTEVPRFWSAFLLSVFVAPESIVLISDRDGGSEFGAPCRIRFAISIYCCKLLLLSFSERMRLDDADDEFAKLWGDIEDFRMYWRMPQ